MSVIRLLSYNIHKGFNPVNSRFVLRRIKETIALTHADVVLLQEVVGHNARHAGKVEQWPTVSQFEYLADSLWPHFAYGKNAVYSEGHHGNAVLSKFPIESWENIDVSSSRLERRGLLHAKVQTPNHGKLHLICVHLGLFETDRKRQLDQLSRRILDSTETSVDKNGRSEPIIIGGDFNDWRGKASPQLAQKLGVKEVFLELYGAHARSFPAWLPVLRLDRIYYRGLSPIRGEVFIDPPWDKLSDHAALYAELAL